MTQEEIIRIAREAGFHIENWSFGERVSVYESGKTIDITNELKDFAALVAAHEREKQAEQEPVATVVDESEEQTNTMSWILSLPLPVGTKLYAAPVRTKDLTDDELDIFVSEKTMDMRMTLREFARAVIAADREKNRG